MSEVEKDNVLQFPTQPGMQVPDWTEASVNQFGGETEKVVRELHGRVAHAVRGFPPQHPIHIYANEANRTLEVAMFRFNNILMFLMQQTPEVREQAAERAIAAGKVKGVDAEG